MLMAPPTLDGAFSVEALAEAWRYAVEGPSKETRSKVLRAAATVARGGRPEPHGDPRVDRAAAALEMCHLGALLHDDVVDGSELRRGLPSVLVLYGAPLAAATGAGIFGRAMSMLSGCGDEAAALAAQAAARACAGQILELRALYDVDRSRERYLEAVRGKTGGMFWVAAQLGGLLEGADAVLLDRFARYGEALGTAFQIVDDILDLAADERDTGKPRGGDLRNGNYTLPVIYALEECPGLADLLIAEAPIDRLIDCIGATAALGRAGTEARRWLDRAKAALDGAPAATGLLEIADAELGRLASVRS